MKTNRKPLYQRKAFIIILILLVGFISIQFVRPDVPNPPVTGDFNAPADVKAIIQRACYDCHSNQTNLRWYDKIAPVYWGVADHIKDGRAGLNFSEWNKLAPGDQKAKLWESINQVLAGAMPLPSYTAVHTEAKLSPTDISVLKNYLASMIHSKPADTAAINTADRQYQHWQGKSTEFAKLPVAANGIAYIPDYKNWQPISTTDREDNNTLRVIFGNDVAVKAIKENNIHPWPNGAIFAKVAWAQLQDKDGTTRTGEFKQVEYMIKDDKKYASTAGWGWARFRTPKMVPYGGANVLFAKECVSCHKPLANEDFVFTQPIKH
ncbi:heme-binding domain-containing protein [Mucilaginibacter sp. CAU 1740]|uniref:heme-binding domain-containing protein n=1 Tax=Mucilaginibacter sp. CAU 1740 TaxID=3140365 RepID=UPI00325A96CA